MKKILTVMMLFLSSIAFGYGEGAHPGGYGEGSVQGGPRPFYEQASDPSAQSNTGWLYTKDNSSATELYYEDDVGNVTQLSSSGFSGGVTWTTSTDLYVTKTGVDTANCTAAAPCLTIQRATTVASKYSPTTLVTINIGNGTYTEYVTLPNNFSGNLKYLGTNGKANVIWDSTGNNFSSNYAKAKIEFDGIGFVNTAGLGYVIINNVGSYVTIKDVSFTGFGGAAIQTIYNASTTTGTTGGTIAITGSGTGVALKTAHNSQFFAYRSITISGVMTGVDTYNNSSFSHSYSPDVTMSITTAASGTTGITTYRNSYATLQNVAIDMNGATTSNRCYQTYDSSRILIAGSSTSSCSNSYYGATVSSFSAMLEGGGGVAWTWTTVTTPILAEYGSSLATADKFDNQTITWVDTGETGSVKADATVNLYVDDTTPTGGSAPDDGANCSVALTPCATIQRAVNVAAGYNATSDVIINIAAGTYAEDVVVPKSFAGSMKLLGADKSTVTWNGGAGVTFDTNYSPGTFHIDEITFSNGTTALYNKSSQMILYDIAVSGFTEAGIRTIYGARTNFSTTVLTTLTLAGTGATYGIATQNNSSMAIPRPITITGVDFGVYVYENSVISSYDDGSGATITITTSGASDVGFYLRENSYALIDNLVIDGTAPFVGSGNWNQCFRIQQSSHLNMRTNKSVSCSNMGIGVFAVGKSSIDANDTVTWTYTNVTHEAWLDYDTSIQSVTLLGGADIEYTQTGQGGTGAIDYTGYYGFDYRYPELIAGGHSGAAPAGSTVYFKNDTTQSDLFPLYIAEGTEMLTSLRIYTGTSNGAASSDVYTVVKNGVATSLAVTIANGSTGALTSTTVGLVAGDVVGLKGVFSGTSTAANIRAQAQVIKR